MTVLMVAIISVVTMRSSYYEMISESLDDSILYSVKMLQDGRYLGLDSGKVSYFDGKDMHPSDLDYSLISDEKTKQAALLEYNDQRLKADFVDYLTSNLDGRIDSVDIDIYGADAEYGLLSARVTAHFTYPGVTFGSPHRGSVTVYKTAILNRYKD